MGHAAWIGPLLLVACGVGIASCTNILGDFQPPGSSGQGGGDTTSSTDHTSSSRASTGVGGSGGSGGGPECKVDGDCPLTALPCAVPSCDHGKCTTVPVSKGKPSPKQTPGDCQQIICDAGGASHMVTDVTDIDDQNPCTNDSCSASGVPSHQPTGGLDCNADGGKKCNDQGQCVACLAPADCSDGGACENFVCQTATCSDGLRNGSETDVDCGGVDCPTKCDDYKHCDADGDCVHGLCQGDHCRPSHCDDGGLNGSETDIDCGGACLPCDTGKTCVAGSDCASQVCQAGTCRIATCGDGSLDGNETDVDCGSDCGPCGAGLGCAVDGDCVSGTCSVMICAP